MHAGGAATSPTKFFGLNLDKLGRNLGKSDQDLGKFDLDFVKSQSCIPKNISFPTAMQINYCILLFLYVYDVFLCMQNKWN